VIEVLQQYASEFIAGFAVILAAVANWRVVRAERAAAVAQKAARRMDMLIEIEQKNAVVGKLALVTAQKMLLLQRHPDLVPSPEGEMERLRNNLDMLQEFKKSEDKQRQVAEAPGVGSDIELHSKALTDIRRLRVRLEADVDKETQVYTQLLESSRGHVA
jgi:hypothetical protein